MLLKTRMPGCQCQRKAVRYRNFFIFRWSTMLVRHRDSVIVVNQSGTAITDYSISAQLYVRGVNTIKCECVNKMTTIRARRMFIS
jgi:hypothetical protein